MPTVNEYLADAAISHAVDLQRYGNGVVQRIIALLNRVDADLMAQLSVAMESLGPESYTVERLESMLVSVRRLNAEAYRAAGLTLTDELRELVSYEAGYQFELFRSALPPQVLGSATLQSVNAGQVYSAAMARPFQGLLLREFSERAGEARMVRVRDAIRMGYVEGQTVGQITRRIRGTRAAGYADGLLEIDRRHAEAVVRTAVQHTAAVTRDAFVEANEDLIESVVWRSTLDARTTADCRLRDGLKYSAVGHKPIGHKVPWGAGPGRLHWNCRSTATPVTKSFRELGIDIDDLDPGTRASMDGQVPADQSYGQWLKKQSAARQDDILGPTRGKLLRDGGLEMDRFYNDRGKWLTLDELRERDAAAFRRAGV